jgi:cellobiose phosphorylase
MIRKFETKYGYFTEKGREYVITNHRTPRPWINVISNGNYGLVISQVNGGFSWITHSNLNRLTRWSQDLIQDNWGKYIYLKDEESGIYWSPTIQPVLKEVDEYSCRHGIGYTVFKSRYQNILANLRIFVPFDHDLEIWTLNITNLSERPRKLGIYTYLEWCLGVAPDNHREFHKTFMETEFDEKKQIILARKRLWEIPSPQGHWNTDWKNIAFFACDESINSFECDKEHFIGSARTLANPVAVETGNLSRTQSKWNDSVASLHLLVSIPSSGEKELHFFLGAHPQQANIYELIDNYRTAGTVEEAFLQAQNEWNTILDASTVETPDEALNFMTNHWLKYQAISGRIWGRAAYYQQSGAFGFRDQLQDSQIFLYSKPELTKKQLFLHAAHQFKNGRVLHWWHPITEQGLDANMSDDLLWLPFVMIHYLKETADWSSLDETVGFYDDPVPTRLLDHCLRAIDLVQERFSERGLPLILAGDWNDGLSAVGLQGKGESVWLAHFLYFILNEYCTILTKINKPNKAIEYQSRAKALRSAINNHGWDGKWFWRASKDNGELIGSQSNIEGKIYLNPQIWSIIAQSTGTERQNKVLQLVEEELECEVGPVLLKPAYSSPDPYIGYISRYAPGVRENGGVYSHAATWSIWAAAILNKPEMVYRLYRKLCPIYNSMEPNQYMAEPYVTSGNIDGQDSPHYRRGGWTWYTGSAAWLFRVTYDYLLGIQADYDGLIINPVIPDAWKKVNIRRLFRSVVYHIEILNKSSRIPGKMVIKMNGKKLTGNKIPVMTGQSPVNIIISLG